MSKETPFSIDFGSLSPADLERAVSEFKARDFQAFEHDSDTVTGAQQYSLEFLEFVQSVLPVLVGKVETPAVATKYDLLTDPERAAKAVWNGTAKFWAAVESPTNYQLTMETLMTHLKLREGVEKETFLSLGSGPGLYETFLGNTLAGIRGPQGSKIICVDYAQEMTSMHRRLLQSARNDKGQPITNVQPVTGDMTALRFPDRSVDQIFCNNSLQWTSDWRKAISEMARVINPDRLAYLYLFTNTHSMLILGSDGTRVERGDLPADQLMDTLEANRFRLLNLRQFTTAPGLGQLGSHSSRLFILAQYRPNGDFSSWRKGNAQAALSMRGR